MVIRLHLLTQITVSLRLEEVLKLLTHPVLMDGGKTTKKQMNYGHAEMDTKQILKYETQFNLGPTK